ncbi:hypothetical protein NEMIN01_1731 [Nematocida minor]|uniref:uncharacterized protein n=1 Tax=Nematocida minor TaxID=1912983 RepID=UPI0022205A71|nr:uncharacterized protein NEMIN01_1731 [Nematocida minor]KAI5191913.1 hypothetical protein NEMIN01_1731 [Nematocida minor]
MPRVKSSPQEPKRVKIETLTEDAIATVLSKANDYTVFRKQGDCMTNEYAKTLSEMLEKMSAQEEDKENLFANESAPKSANKTVTLATWAIKLIEASEGVLELIVFGVIKDTSDIVQSSFINKRVSSHCVVSKSTTYLLEGGLDTSVTPYPGFREEVTEKFKDGFPMQWRSIVKAEAQRIKEVEGREQLKAKYKPRKRRKYLN